MAAALRLQAAARKLVGDQRTRSAVTTAVSRSQPAAAQGQRRCLSNDEAFKHQVEEELARELRGHAEVERVVERKKEELYDALAKAQRSFWTRSLSNTRLLEHLAVKIKPRPEDSRWRRLRFSRKANNVMEAAGLIGLTGLIAFSSEHCKGYVEDMKLAWDMKKQ